MIYIPHPTFNFEKSDGGWVIGSVFGSSFSFYGTNIFSGFPRPENIKIHVNAISSYWNVRKYRTYSFVREDGKEFAARFIFNANVDVIGYWCNCKSEDHFVIDSPMQNLISGGGSGGGKVPLSYVEFLKWFVSSVKG